MIAVVLELDLGEGGIIMQMRRAELELGDHNLVRLDAAVSSCNICVYFVGVLGIAMERQIEAMKCTQQARRAPQTNLNN